MSLLNKAQEQITNNPEQHSSPLSADLIKIKACADFTVEGEGKFLRLHVDTSSWLGLGGYINLANLTVMAAAMEVMNKDELASLFLEGTVVLNLWAGKSGVLVADFGPAKVFEDKRNEAMEKKKKKNLPPPAGEEQAPPA